jgi:hypothetical protein
LGFLRDLVTNVYLSSQVFTKSSVTTGIPEVPPFCLLIRHVIPPFADHPVYAS